MSVAKRYVGPSTPFCSWKVGQNPLKALHLRPFHPHPLRGKALNYMAPRLSNILLLLLNGGVGMGTRNRSCTPGEWAWPAARLREKCTNSQEMILCKLEKWCAFKIPWNGMYGMIRSCASHFEVRHFASPSSHLSRHAAVPCVWSQRPNVNSWSEPRGLEISYHENWCRTFRNLDGSVTSVGWKEK